MQAFADYPLMSSSPWVVSVGFSSGDINDVPVEIVSLARNLDPGTYQTFTVGSLVVKQQATPQDLFNLYVDDDSGTLGGLFGYDSHALPAANGYVTLPFCLSGNGIFVSKGGLSTVHVKAYGHAAPKAIQVYSTGSYAMTFFKRIP
jgi:hypothetical protein